MSHVNHHYKVLTCSGVWLFLEYHSSYIFHLYYYCHRITQLGTDVYELKADIALKNVMIEDILEEKGSGKDGTGKGSGKGQWEKGKDKGKGGKDDTEEGKGKVVGQHGGWMPKCAKLAKAYKKKNWDGCNVLINTFSQSSSIFRDLVQKHG
jgi:hypothetical protein